MIISFQILYREQGNIESNVSGHEFKYKLLRFYFIIFKVRSEFGVWLAYFYLCDGTDLFGQSNKVISFMIPYKPLDILEFGCSSFQNSQELQPGSLSVPLLPPRDCGLVELFQAPQRQLDTVEKVNSLS